MDKEIQGPVYPNEPEEPQIPEESNEGTEPEEQQGMYFTINSDNQVGDISDSPMNTENEIFIPESEFPDGDYMNLFMKIYDSETQTFSDPPKMKTIYREIDGSSGEIEESMETPEGWTEEEVPSGMHKPVFYKGEWVEEEVKRVREENKRLNEELSSMDTDFRLMRTVVLTIMDEKFS